MNDLEKASPLLDRGKVGVTGGILLKPRPLTAEVRKVVQSRCELGDQLLAAAETLPGEIRRRSGPHLEPRVVEAFSTLVRSFR